MKQHPLQAIVRAGLVALVAIAASARPAAAQDARAVLSSLCGPKSTEPVCEAQTDLTEDEAWLLVHAACRKATSPVATCEPFRKQSRMVLTFDAGTDDWFAEFEGKALPLKFDVAGTPTLRLKPKAAKPMKIVVTNISPLVYSASPGTPKEDDLDVIAGLKVFLSLAGTGIQTLIQTAAFSPAAAPPAALPTSQPGVKIVQPHGGVKLTIPPPPVSCSPNVGELAARVLDRTGLLQALNRNLQQLDRRLAGVDDARHRFIKTIEKAEDGTTVPVSELTPVSDGDITAAYKAFEDAVGALAQNAADLDPCVPMLNAYSILLGAPADGAVVDSLAGQVNKAAATCTNAKLTLDVETNLKQLQVDCAGTLEPTLKVHAAALKPLVDRLLNTRQVEEKVWQAVGKTHETQNSVMTGIATLNREITKGRLHSWNGELVRELVVTRQNPELRWNKIQSHSVVIKPDTPYVKEARLAHGAEAKHEYKLESVTGQLLGYGIGIIYTPLHESTWTAASLPGSTSKVIAETKRETRAGDLAAFLSYRFMEHMPAKRLAQPTLDFGVGLTSDRPAFFIGVGLEVLRAARIGFGWAPERVTMLDKGQTVNVTTVSGNDDIRTVKRFDTRNWYVSFSFALDSLSLFNKS